MIWMRLFWLQDIIEYDRLGVKMFRGLKRCLTGDKKLYLSSPSTIAMFVQAYSKKHITNMD